MESFTKGLTFCRTEQSLKGAEKRIRGEYLELTGKKLTRGWKKTRNKEHYTFYSLSDIIRRYNFMRQWLTRVACMVKNRNP
jgi:hypothetical protein